MTTKRRGTGEGSICQRKDGRWLGAISLGYGENGRRKRVTVSGKTKRECQDKLTRLQRQKLDGSVTEMSRITLKEYLMRWVEDSVRPNQKHATYVSYNSMVKNHVIPSIGTVMIAKLTPAHVQGMLSEMERRGIKAGLRSHILKVLKCAINQAVKWNLIPRNVCSAVKTPNDVTREIRPLTAEQARLLLQEAKGDRYEAVYVLAITTGMRQGEILALQWDDIDFDSGALSVRYTLSWVNRQATLTTPKTAKSRRLIDLPALAVDASLGHQRRMMIEGNAGGSWVFCNRKGMPIRGSNDLVRASFNPLLKKAELPKVRFHDLRHTSATLMLMEGVHPKVVQERLGHSKISMTLDTYSHVVPTMQKEASEKMNRLLSVD